MPFLDDLIGYKYVVQVGQPPLPQRDTLCFSGDSVTVTDDPVNDRTVVELGGVDAAGFVVATAATLTDNAIVLEVERWGAADLVHVSAEFTEGDPWKIFSLPAPGVSGKARKTLANHGDADLLLIHAVEGDTANISCPRQQDYTLRPGGAVDVVYDGSMWFVV